MKNIDTLLFFALKEEFDYFKKILRIKMLSNNGLILCALKTKYNGYFHFYAYYLSKMGRMSVTEVLPDLIRTYSPKLIINIGIAGRVNNDFLIGDVIIAESIYDIFENGKIRDNPNGGYVIQSNVTQKEVDRKIANSCFSYWEPSYYLKLFQKYHKLNFTSTELNSLEVIRRVPKIETAPILSSPLVDISENIKDQYQRINRNIAVVEMEAYSIQQVVNNYNSENNGDVKTLFIKGISDYANISKDNEFKHLHRRYAMFNSTMLFKNFINYYPIKKEENVYKFEHIDEIFNSKHLSSKNQHNIIKEQLNDSNFNLFSRLFSNIISSENINVTAPNIFEEIFTKISSMRPQQSINFSGYSGSGKTSFLICLYYYLLNKFQEDNKIFPIYINIEYYYSEYNLNVGIDLSTFVLKSFELDIHDVEKILDTLTFEKVILVVDGIDALRDDKDLLGYFNYFSGLNNHRIVKIFGIQIIPEKTILNCPKIILPFNSEYEVSFSSMNYDNPNLEGFISLFYKFIGKEVNLKEASLIHKKLQAKKLQDIDFFTLTLIIDNKNIYNDKDLNIHELINNYCNHILVETNWSIDLLSSKSFDYHIIRKENQLNDYTHLPQWKLIHQNPKIAYSLIAREVIKKLSSVNSVQDDALNNNLSFVFPFQINYFCKEIINQDYAKQSEILNKIKIILQLNNWHSIAVACYLAGRFSNMDIQNQAIQLLEDFLANSSHKVIEISDKDKYLFALRTIYISLSNLGKNDYQNSYIKKLISDKEWDNINRGFHLVYYGDQEYIPKNGLAQNDFLKDCTKTINQLITRIKSKKRSNIYNIELFTLISLIIRRLNTEYISKSLQQEILFLISEKETIDKIENNNEVLSFISYAKSILMNNEFSILTPFEELMNLKFEKRAGWVKRKINNPESVASHTLFTVFLANLYLPTVYPEHKEYDKNKIILMLLIHDLAESRFGDIIKKTDEDKSNENNFFIDLQWVSYLLPYKNDFDGFYSLWDDFENGKTVNGQIAKEIDKIEAYLQLLHYKCTQKKKISDEQVLEWQNDFKTKNTLKHSITKQIYNMIEYHYDIK